MQRLLLPVTVALAAAGGLMFLLRPDPGPFPPPVAAADVAEAPPEPPPSAGGPPPRALKLEVPVPERLQNRHALDPAPLALNFGAPPFERGKDGRIFKTDVIARIDRLNASEHEPVEDLQFLQSLIGSYREIFRENPVAGENHEVVAALTGWNSYQLVFIDPAHPAINSARELTDRWGTPYRFHPVSGTHMEFSSAGRDAQFGTEDDIRLDRAGVAGADSPESAGVPFPTP